MKKQIKKLSGGLAIACICWLGSGCTKGEPCTEISRESVGIIVDVDYIQATWSQSPATVVRTEMGTFFIRTHISVPTGQEAFKTLWSNEKHYLYWEGSDVHYYFKK